MKSILPPKHLKLWVSIVFGAVVFIAAAQWSAQYSEQLQALTDSTGVIGIAAYIGILAASIVFAPLGSGFLVPVAANSFGPFLAALYSIIGWTVGSVIAFILARTVRRVALDDVLWIKRMREYEGQVPPYYRYGLIILLRMALPVDVISYALAIGSSIAFWPFVMTTLIGVTPLTFIFTYASQSTILVQGIVAVFSISIFLLGLWYVRRKFLAPRSDDSKTVR